MKNQEKFYITTTLPYVNSDPHLGFALEMVLADCIARYHRDVLRQEVFFNTGTDEHGLKIYRKAVEEGKDPQKYVDEYAEKFKQLMPNLGIVPAPDLHFIRTTDVHHVSAAQEFWRRCKKDDIYKKNYKIKYCVGCELEKTESELNENGRCSIHPNLEIELIEEENYFFKFSNYRQKLLDLYDKYPDFVVPSHRLTEIKNFTEKAQDFSISRLKEKMPWGVPVPGDDKQVMYVWFDALINYISTLGWPEFSSSPGKGRTKEGSKQNQFNDFWGTVDNPRAIQIAGKDNLRQQSAMWQAMLLSAGLPTSRQIIIHGFITSGGEKMSKSSGNVADPYQILNQLQSKGLTKGQAIDALRYYLLREIPTFEDGDYTWEKFVESYNANLANGIGNLISRILKMNQLANFKVDIKNLDPNSPHGHPYHGEYYDDLIKNYELNLAIDTIWRLIADLDLTIQMNEVYKQIKSDPESAKQSLTGLLNDLYKIAKQLQPFLPQTSEKILEALKNPSEKNIPHLFPRIE